MNNNLIKLGFVFSIFFLRVSLNAIAINDDQNNQEFEIGKINRIVSKIDKSRIEFLQTEGEKIKVERNKVSNFNSAQLSMMANNDTLELNSMNEGRGGCEVNYRVMLPKAPQVEVNSGKLDFHSDVPFNHLLLSTGRLTGKINNPNCNIDLKLGSGKFDIIFDKVLSFTPNIEASMGRGILNLRLPEDATVKSI